MAQYHIVWHTAWHLTKEHRSGFEITKETPYLNVTKDIWYPTLTGEPQGVYGEYFLEYG